MSARWVHVHVGDVVRGADGGAWEVISRTPGPRWIVAGDFDRFSLRCNGREVTTTRKLDEPAPIVTLADHTAEAHAWQALTATFRLDLIGEGMDQFDSPAQEIKRDRWGRYVLPDPETGKEQAWMRVTTLARTLADEFGLNQWAKRNVAKGMALRPDLIAGAAAADPDEDKGTLSSIVEQAEQAAGSKKGSNFGTAFHQAAQRLDRGVSLTSMQLPEALAKDVAAYAEALRVRGIQIIPEAMERIVLVPSLGCAGTLDRIARQPAGVTKSEPLTVLDLKSAKSLDYSWLEIAIQQACYANATHIWAGDHWEPMPAVDKSRALIAHSPIGKGVTSIYGVDLIKGWEFAQLAARVRLARKEKLGWLVEPAPTELALHLVKNAQTQQDLAALWDRFHPAGQWTDEVHAAAGARWEQIHALATV